MANIARILPRAVAVTGVSATTATAFSLNTNPESGFSRSVRFWASTIPCYAEYKYAEYRMSKLPEDSDLNYYSPLHEKYAPKMKDLTLDMQGFYFKMAQVLSTRDEFVPDMYMEWMKKLQGQSPKVLDGPEVRKQVTKALGIEKIEDVFEEWDDKPIGAASIGQVHKAKLKSNGKQVAVKFMLPGVEEKFRNDIRTVETFCKYLMPQHLPFFKEIKRQFATEFDYEGEARNLEEVSEVLRTSPWRKKVVVPEPIPELCSKTVLTMEFIPGENLVDGIRSQFKRFAASSGLDFDELERAQIERIKSGAVARKDIRTASNENLWIRRYLFLRDLAANSIIFIGNWTLNPLISEKPWQYVYSERPINLGGILETLLRVHAHEIFFGGAFNSDPHPGNILLVPDGRLGLIDYGQFKRMELKDRITYAKLIISLKRDDRDEVARLMEHEIGHRSKYMDPDVMWRISAFFHDTDSDEVTLGMNVHTFTEWLDKKDPVISVNDEYIMVGRVSVLLRGIAQAFGLSLRVSDYWHIEAQEFLKHHGIQY